MSAEPHKDNGENNGENGVSGADDDDFIVIEYDPKGVQKGTRMEPPEKEERRRRR